MQSGEWIISQVEPAGDVVFRTPSLQSAVKAPTRDWLIKSFADHAHRRTNGFRVVGARACGAKRVGGREAPACHLELAPAIGPLQCDRFDSFALTLSSAGEGMKQDQR